MFTAKAADSMLPTGAEEEEEPGGGERQQDKTREAC